MTNRRTFSKSTSLLAAVTLLAASTAVPSIALAAGNEASTVVYISGNDIVVKRTADGQFMNFTIPEGYKFSTDGKKLSLSDLHPGSKLSEAITAGDGRVVSEISTGKGKVIQVSPPSKVTLSMTEGFKELMVPNGTKFGAGKKLTELKAGDMIDVTLVTTLGGSDATGNVPPETAPAMTGPLLIASADPDGALPIAGTKLPLFGALGLMMLGAGFYLRRRGAAATARS